jgi:hypothetical protein
MSTGFPESRGRVQRVDGIDHVPTEVELIELSDRRPPYRSLATGYPFGSEYDEGTR